MRVIILFIFIIFNNEYLFSSNLEENIETCNSCHSKEALKADPLIPSINGQEFFYIYTQLKDYKAGRRSHEIMTDIASSLSKDDMKALAQFYSKKEWSPYSFNENYDSVGIEKIVSSGGRNACTKCHVGFRGNSGVPSIGGQKWTYLNHTMRAFKNKERTNAGTKNAIFSGFDYETIELMAKYLSDQK